MFFFVQNSFAMWEEGDVSNMEGYSNEGMTGDGSSGSSQQMVSYIAIMYVPVAAIINLYQVTFLCNVHVLQPRSKWPCVAMFNVAPTRVFSRSQ